MAGGRDMTLALSDERVPTDLCLSLERRFEGISENSFDTSLTSVWRHILTFMWGSLTPSTDWLIVEQMSV